jgi:acetyl esterase/lipase
MPTSRERVLDAAPPRGGVRLPYGPDPLQYGDLWLPASAGPYPVAVVIHGGFWRDRYDLAYMGHACAALASLGVAAWNVEYRRVGNAGGGWPATLLDVGRAADYLRAAAPAYGLDLDRLVALGHSAGGHLALWLAARPRIPSGDALFVPEPLPVPAAIALAGVVDLRRAWELRLSDNAVEALLGGTPDTVPERFAAASPAALLPLGARQTLIHGTRDDTVPFDLAAGYCRQAAAAGDAVDLIPLRGSGHFEVVDPRAREWREVVSAAQAALRSAQ